jgi:hypothetical protein
MFFLSCWVKKTENPRLPGNRGSLEIFFLNQKFVPTMPKQQPTRVQMDMRPLACACFSIGANVVFIFFTLKPSGKETPSRRVCQKIFCAVKNALSDLRTVVD